MKKVLRPARLILCFVAFYFPFVLSSAGQSLTDVESSSQVFEVVNQGSALWGDYYTNGELEKAVDWNVHIPNSDLEVVEYSEDDLFIPLTQAQQSLLVSLIRSTTGIAGSSKNIATNGKTYVMQQSIGQASPIGTFYTKDYIARQGFLQPHIAAYTKGIAIPLSLDANVYPNPFAESVTIAFSEQINEIIDVTVFDALGRIVFSNSYSGGQKVTVDFFNLPPAYYLLKVTANYKLFMKKIIKN
jgi:hypothetical protein